LFVVFEVLVEHLLILGMEKLTRLGYVALVVFECFGVARNDMGVITRGRIQQSHADIFGAVSLGHFIGAIDKHIDHTTIDFIEFVVTNCFVSHASCFQRLYRRR
jgi:hypothetical protein